MVYVWWEEDANQSKSCEHWLIDVFYSFFGVFFHEIPSRKESDGHTLNELFEFYS